MSKKTFSRSSRVGMQFHRLIAGIISEKIKDPRIKDVTITDVVISKDLRLAKVYFVIYKKSYEIKDVLKGFDTAKGYLKRIIAHKINLRYMPDILFFYDNSFDYGSYIDKLLKSV